MPDEGKTWVYQNITEDKLRALAAKLEQPYAPMGEAVTHNVRISWEYEAGPQILTVTAHNETWMVKFGTVKNRLDGLLI